MFKRRGGFFTSRIYPSAKIFSLVCDRAGMPQPRHQFLIRNLGLKVMFVITAEFRLKPDMLNAFMPLMLIQAEKSLSSEPGCLVFDVCIEHNDSEDVVFLYEAYEDEAAFDQHMETPHYLAFSETTSDLVAAKSVRRFDRITSQTGSLQ